MLKSVSKLRLLVDETRDAYLRGDVNYIIELDGIAERIEREVSERYMELPLDADGVPIRVGDKMRDGTVTCIRDSGKGWEILLSNWNMYQPCDLNHYHKPTIEDVLQEVVAEVQLGINDVPHIVAEYAKRLRLAGDGE